MTVVTFVADGLITELQDRTRATLARRSAIIEALSTLGITNSGVLASAVANIAAGPGNPYWFKERAAAVATALGAADDLNTPVTLAAITGQDVVIGTPTVVALTIGGNDVDLDTISIVATSSDAADCLAAVSGAAEITLIGLGAGTPTITVTISDGKGSTASRSFVATVTTE